jgi:hypothetical protein
LEASFTGKGMECGAENNKLSQKLEQRNPLRNRFLIDIILAEAMRFVNTTY